MTPAQRTAILEAIDRRYPPGFMQWRALMRVLRELLVEDARRDRPCDS